MLYLAGPRVLPVLLLIVFPLVAGPYWQKVVLSIAAYGLLALGWDFFYKAGLICMGQALFFGVGAYMSGALNHYWHWSPWLAIPTATVVGAGICTLVLSPVLRLRGIYFAMVTLVLPLMLVRLIEATRIFGGTDGITGISSLPNSYVETYGILFVAVGTLFGFRRVMSMDYGLVLRAVNDNDRAVIRAGHNIYWLKAQALFIGGCAGTFAGAYLTHAYMFVGMPAFALDYSILPIAAAVVGGPGTLAGPAIGALVLVPLSELLRALGALRIVAYGLFLVVFAVAVPEGLFSFLVRKYHQFERWIEVDS
ncbi:MAG: branched-chain amino acid ABC transporter permease [Deltaproteobacteria bacterium]|nr:branched-chain amino acid ABC transporter permease [Deltaproteobacteria bacterium]